jgi:cytochrome b involved in lipid metabolism
MMNAMKREVTIALFIFFVVAISIVTAGLVFYDQNKSSLLPTIGGTTGSATNTPANNNNPMTETKVGLTTSEIAKHNIASDCWMIINNNVYNLSSFLNKHPAGADIMIPYCGKDGTQAFATKGGKGDPHSSQAQAMLPSYLIGQLGQSVPTSQTTITSSISTSTPTGNRNRGGDNEIDD